MYKKTLKFNSMHFHFVPAVRKINRETFTDLGFYETLLKHQTRASSAQKQDSFRASLAKLFDIAFQDAASIISNDSPRTWVMKLKILPSWLTSSERSMFMCIVDTEYEGKISRKVNWEFQQERRPQLLLQSLLQ